MHISITGKLGSGKSTICDILKSSYGYKIYSTGSIQRKFALERSVSTLEMNQLMVEDISFDFLIDDAVTKISSETKNETIIFDSRMAWKFAEKSFKVFVTVDPFVAAGRVMKDQRGKEEIYSDIEDAMTKLNKRSSLENERFRNIYNVDSFDYLNYNIVIDSTNATPQELANIIYSHYLSYDEHNCETHEIFMSPTCLFPLEGIRSINSETLNDYISNRQYLNSKISIIAFDGYHYIVDGHHRCLAAILNEETFVKAKTVDVDEYPFFNSTQNLISEINAAGISLVYDYEELGKFRYKSYPKYYFNV